MLQQQGLRVPRNIYWKADGFAVPGQEEGGTEATPGSPSAWRQPCRTGASEELWFCSSSGCWVLKAWKTIALCCAENLGGMLGSLERKKRAQGIREAAAANWLYGSAWHVISVWIPKLNHFSSCTVRIWGRSGCKLFRGLTDYPHFSSELVFVLLHIYNNTFYMFSKRQISLCFRTAGLKIFCWHWDEC